MSVPLLPPEQALDPTIQTTLVVTIALLLCLGPVLTEQPLSGLLALSIAGWVALVWYGLLSQCWLLSFGMQGLNAVRP